MKHHLEAELQPLPLKCQAGPQSPASVHTPPYAMPSLPDKLLSILQTQAKCQLLCEVYQISPGKVKSFLFLSSNSN